MTHDFRHALLAAFERGFAAPPRNGERWLMLNAHALPANAIAEAGLDDDVFREALACEQGFRPLFLELGKSGYAVSPQVEVDGGFDHAIVFTSRARAINLRNFHRAWEMVKPGGQIIICGDKRSGADGIGKLLSKSLAPPQRFSKYHALCLLLLRGDHALPEPLQPDTEKDTREGLFSASGPDAGSQLLAAHISEAVSGKVADFGAGWGYLSQQLLEKGGNITALDLFEAEYQALEAAKSMLAAHKGPPINYHWCDLSSEPVAQRFDWIVMNPPFHHGHAGSRQARPDIGKTFIEKAASRLAAGGRLLMVANRTLAYEETLTRCFSRTEKLAEEGGYKIIQAVR